MTLPGGDSGDTPRDQTGEELPPPAYEHPAGPPPQYGAPDPARAHQYSAGGYPGPGGYPPAGGYGNTQQTTTNTMAIASLVISVLGIVPFCGGLLSIVGITLGAVALSQIKETRQEGYGLAVAGIVVGVAMLIVGLIWTIFALR
ncbi:hypothetical protein BH10ACT9_BH10ACT9_44900 [soil metagenome]